MPAPSFLDPLLMGNARVSLFKRNTPPVPEFLRFGNCFWYILPPGYTEGGPKVILEAMSAGLSCIADNHSGMKDRITPETGWLVDNFEETIEIIKNLTPTILKDKGEAARERARKEFVAENWIYEILGA